MRYLPMLLLLRMLKLYQLFDHLPRLTDASTPPAGAARTVRRSRGRDAGTAGTGARDHGHETGLAERVGGEQARAHLYIAREGRTRLAEDDRRTPPRHRHRRTGPDRFVLGKFTILILFMHCFTRTNRNQSAMTF